MLTAGFLPKLIRLFAVHHWSGFEQTTDQLGGLESCHALGTRTAKAFIAHFASKKGPAGQPQPALAALGDAAALAPLADIAGPADAPPADGGNQNPANAGDVQVQAASVKTQEDWAKINAARRDVMGTFWKRRPLWKLVACRKVLTPLHRHQRSGLKRSAARWEIKQRAKMARVVRQGKPLKDVRTYRLLDAARNTLERTCLGEIRSLFDGEEPWECVMAPEPDGMTVHARALANRMAVKAGCGMVQNFEGPHEGFPFLTYLIPWQPEVAERLDKECRMVCPGQLVDPWSRGLWEQFPSVAQLQSRACHAVIMLKLLLGTIDISKLDKARDKK